MGDHLIRVLGKEAGVRGMACVTTELVQEAARRHGTSPVATAALGQGLTAAVLLGALLKVQQRVAVKISGSGAVQKIVAEGDSYGHVRGYVVPTMVGAARALTPNLIAQAIGQQGKLTVVKDLRVRRLYESTVSLQTGYLDADLTYYLNQSEQTPSVVEIGVKQDASGNVVAAGGLLLQTLPDESETAVLETLTERLDDLPNLEEMLADGRTPSDLLATIFRDVEFEWLEERALQFRCGCSRERSAQALRLLSREELEGLIEDGEAVVDCHFCQERYIFGREELRQLLEEERTAE